MKAMLHSWWQKAKKPLEVAVVSVLITGFIALIIIIILGYIFDWSWAGLGPYSPSSKDSGFQPGKTLWDWLQLLIIPAVLAVGGYLFNFTTSRTERNVATDNQREAALKEYFDQLAYLLLEKKLRDSQPDDEVRKIARVRTLTVLPRLDKRRKRSILGFLHESGLLSKDMRIINLRGADLSGAFLVRDYLTEANLSGANLSGADLSGADLRGAKFTEEQLKQVKSCKGAITLKGVIVH